MALSAKIVFLFVCTAAAEFVPGFLPLCMSAKILCRDRFVKSLCATAIPKESLSGVPFLASESDMM
jgi:hypothetical protein